jgi:alpha-beta hydrolase superfamily lysophospholipase
MVSFAGWESRPAVTDSGIVETDVLGPPYTSITLALTPDDEGEVFATLVHRPADPGAPSASGPRPAVLHVHGFADYFFHTEYAEWWTARGYDFFAVDLRKYGRSIRDHQTPNYVADLEDYYEELDAAWSFVTAEHTRVILSAHSTGGLVLPIWADTRKLPVTAMVLNSPWFDLRGSLLLRTVGTKVIDVVGAAQPKRVIPREVSGLYGRSLHREHEGEWEFNVDWKPMDSWPLYAGWLRAIRRGHAKLQAGLSLPFPVLVLSSARTSAPAQMGDEVHGTDIVLDVKQIRRWAGVLGTHVTSIGIEGARHDVTLSLEPVRKQVYDELERWLSAYVSPAARTSRGRRRPPAR